VLPYDEYIALRELAEDAEGAAALARFAKRYGSGREETVPVEVVDRLLAGESPLSVARVLGHDSCASRGRAADYTGPYFEDRVGRRVNHRRRC
jgi:hypothetical protein